MDHLRRDASIGYKISFRLHTLPALQATRVCLQEPRPEVLRYQHHQNTLEQDVQMSQSGAPDGSRSEPLSFCRCFQSGVSPLFTTTVTYMTLVAGVQALQALTVRGPTDCDGSQAANLPIWGGASLHAHELNCQAMIMQFQQDRGRA